MLNVVIFGAPGSGKGTQSELIIKEYGLDHISTGDVLRGEMKAETELGKIAKDYIEKGQLVPDELIVDMLANVLDSKKPAKGVIFDGFPRTIPSVYWSAVKYPDVLTITWRRSNPDWMFTILKQLLWQTTM